MQAVGNKESRLCGRDIENSRSGAGGKKKDKTPVSYTHLYRGNEDGKDTPLNGGSYVDETGDAHEKYNFTPVNKMCIRDRDIVDEECDQSVRAGVLIERLKGYEPEFPKNLDPMVSVNYCEESAIMNPRCPKVSELDAKTAEMDKEWYAKRDSKTEEPTKITKLSLIHIC